MRFQMTTQGCASLSFLWACCIRHVCNSLNASCSLNINFSSEQLKADGRLMVLPEVIVRNFVCNELKSPETEDHWGGSRKMWPPWPDSRGASIRCSPAGRTYTSCIFICAVITGWRWTTAVRVRKSDSGTTWRTVAFDRLNFVGRNPLLQNLKRTLRVCHSQPQVCDSSATTGILLH